MNRQRKVGLLVSASLHAMLLSVLTMSFSPLSEPLNTASPSRRESIEVEIIDVSDLRDRAFTFDIDKIAARADRLFPFVDSMSLLPTAPMSRAAKQYDSPMLVPESHLARPLPPLNLSAAEMQSVLDESWSRRDRWASFQPLVDLVGGFDFQTGDLPDLLRRYVNENVLQPFRADRNLEPKLWALLSVASDHSEFVRFITGFIRRVPASKVSTELLFLLDKLVQSNVNALQSLVALDIVGGLEWTKKVSPSGAATLVAIHGFHKRALDKRGLWDTSALADRYDHVRLDILDHLIRTSPQGYRVNDARFLIGEIYWRKGRATDAFRVWRQIRPDTNDQYFGVSSELLNAMRLTPIRAVQIDVALGDETRRWTYASFVRLRQFGFQFDSF